MGREEQGQNPSHHETTFDTNRWFPERIDPKKTDSAFSIAGDPILPLDESLAGTPFEIPMPPPNITGKLHMGHALDLSIQDTALRLYAMRGAATRWIPGCDHASISTHEKIIQTTGLSEWKSERGALEYARAGEKWADEHRRIIMGQFRSMHPLANWKEETYTLDPRFSEAIDNALARLSGMGRILSPEPGSLMLDLRPEARALCLAMESGEISIRPKGHGARLINMLKEERLWDIGRDIPWGHRRRFKADFDGTATPIPIESSEGFETCLDTWLSSALWPGATAPLDNPLRRFDSIIIGYDISYFWGARMLMIGMATTGQWPFGEMLLHGLIRDKNGTKFSKSLGNGIDPTDIIESFGSDAMRLWCCENAAWGRDMRMERDSPSKMAKIPNKLSNAARLIAQRALSSIGDERWLEDFAREIQSPSEGGLDWDKARGETLSLMREWRIDEASKRARAFFWNDFCSRWLESAKKNMSSDGAQCARAARGAIDACLLLHPFAPASTWLIHSGLKELISFIQSRREG